MVSNNHITWHEGDVSRADREELLDQKGKVYWFYGLSGSGKSTIAVEAEKYLLNQGKLVYRLDGDNIRHGLNANLGFSTEDRSENIRRIAETAKLFADCGIIVLVSFITPLRKYRSQAKSILAKDLKLIYVKASLESCIKRDPKGLYQKALQGEINNFTGISAPFEDGEGLDSIIDTNINTLTECIVKISEILT